MSSFRPPHGLLIKWGPFRLNASGLPAVLTVLATVVAGFVGRLYGLW